MLPMLFLSLFLFTFGVNKDFLNQNFDASYNLSPGMTKIEVEKIMGRPAKSDFSKNVEEWHYCKTGMGSDELIEKLNYTVTLSDTKGATGSCEKFNKMGN